MPNLQEQSKKTVPPTKQLSYQEWQQEIQSNLPDLWYAADACASAYIQLFIPEMVNPVALVLKDAPSSGKTVCLNFFSGLTERIVYNDEFTENALVSGNQGQKDFIEEMKDKCTIIPDLATILHSSEDKVRSILGKFTRLLDGQGYAKASATAADGQKKHGIAKGERHFFVMLMATTELTARAHECMSGLGPRMLFMDVGSKRPTREDIIRARQEKGLFLSRELLCKEATTSFIRTMQVKEYTVAELDDEIYGKIADIAIAMAYMRSDIQVGQDKFDKNGMVHSIPQREHAWRLMTCLENIVRSHAFLRGAGKVELEDLAAPMRFLFSSGPSPRPQVLQEIIKAGGTIDNNTLSTALQFSYSRSKQEMEILKLLKFGTVETDDDDDIFNAVGDTYYNDKITHTFTLSQELSWLYSSEWLEFYEEFRIF